MPKYKVKSHKRIVRKGPFGIFLKRIKVRGHTRTSPNYRDNAKKRPRLRRNRK